MPVEVIVLRTHQALWSRKRGYGLKDDGSVVEFRAPDGASGMMYFGQLMNATKAAIQVGNCFGLEIDDAQIVKEVGQPLQQDQAERLFSRTIWAGSKDRPPSLGPEEMQMVIGIGRTF